MPVFCRARVAFAAPLVLLVTVAAMLLPHRVEAEVNEPSQPPQAATRVIPPVGHVFVINLENKGFDTTFGPGSKAPYLSQTLRNEGILFTQYYGTAHNSAPNYIAQISGQGPNSETQADCQIYDNFTPAAGPVVPPQQAVGQGCVYPSTVTTVANQLDAARLSWKAYMEIRATPKPSRPSLRTVAIRP